MRKMTEAVSYFLNTNLRQFQTQPETWRDKQHTSSRRAVVSTNQTAENSTGWGRPNGLQSTTSLSPVGCLSSSEYLEFGEKMFGKYSKL